MTDFNPYQPPKTPTEEFLAFNSQRITCYGKNGLFIPVGTDLPARCIYCNQPATDKTIKQTFYHDRMYPLPVMIIVALMLIAFSLYQLIAIMIFVIAIINSLTQRKINIYMQLCANHSKKRFMFRLYCFGVFIISFLSIFLINNSNINNTWILFAVLTMLISLLVMSFTHRLPRASKIDKTGCYLKGFGEEFLQNFL